MKSIIVNNFLNTNDDEMIVVNVDEGESFC